MTHRMGAESGQDLVEYALGLPPKTGNASPLLVTSDPGTLTLGYSRNLAATDTVLQIQHSDSLAAGSWLNISPVSDTLISTDGSVQTREAVLPAAGTRGFYRITATRP